jgi:hypothetical protein
MLWSCFSTFHCFSSASTNSSTSCVSVSFRSTTLAAAVLFPVDEAALSVLAGVSCSGSAGVAELDGLEACGGIWNWLESF